ncbi:MAG: class I SAM-dependent methyltransferase [Candidatus Omnitrophica bacterium]|nr:class I SAM-dependent methyltransferase [Candidatus Omnitrophota bacterium]
MKIFFYKIVGRLSLFLDCFKETVLINQEEKEHKKGKDIYDRTGLLTEKSVKTLKVNYKDKDIIFPLYKSFSHSFWRAQELSLFYKYKNYIVSPILDFGCGDGSFSANLFDQIDYGLDYDEKSLEIAKKLGIYKYILKTNSLVIPLANCSIRTVIANSVLEHVKELDLILKEIKRVLVEKGLLIFTVTTSKFSEHLIKFFGKKECEKINREYYHKNLLSLSDWEKKLRMYGFSIEKVQHYQDEIFTFWYRISRIFGKHGLARLYPNISELIYKVFNRQITKMIYKAIDVPDEGANIFIISRKC